MAWLGLATEADSGSRPGSKDGPLASLKMGAPRRPQRLRVGATGHLGDFQGCASSAHVPVLVTGDSREAEMVCAQPGSPRHARAHLCGPVPCLDARPADAGWRRQMLL